VDPAAVARDLERIRATAPLVHNITNFVVMESTANALLALGAAPVMAHALEEVEEITSLASALVLNIGTLSGPWIQAMHRSGTVAAARRIPVVLDPVGAGASTLRTRTALELLESASPAVVRGNASEILTLAGEAGGARGVDATAGVEAARGPAGALARRAGLVVSVSGTEDVITDGTRELRILNSTPLMARVTGMGCTATALTAAFCAVNAEPLRAAAHAMAVMGVAAEIAREEARGPGSFLPAFHDVLHRLEEEALASRLRSA
jgi:hydroxyethylthiazole kinase